MGYTPKINRVKIGQQYNKMEHKIIISGFGGQGVVLAGSLLANAALLENKKVPIPITKTLLLTRQDNILYLIDVNNKDRWIDEESFSKAKIKAKK